jgi:exopolysaccharide biosynthesis polyprenyl glycosylphosphotransferase
MVVRHRFEQGIDRRNVLIVGIGRTGQALRHHIESIRHLGYGFKGFVINNEAVPEPLRGAVLGDMNNLLAVARANFVEEIFICTHCDRNELLSLVEEASHYGISIRLVPDLYDGLTWNAQMEFVGHFPTVPLHHYEFPLISYIAKRSLDLVLSITALVTLAPVLILIALAVKIDSPGPVFYWSDRIGRKGKSFRCMKFRTMVREAENIRSTLEHMNERESVLFKISNDPRVTRMGKLLRKYSLDELPQFINVLLGEMSIVGPRPPLASEVAQYDLSHLRRLDVLPGITGLWQVEARQDPSFDSYISLDTAYVENWSIWMDIKILLRTVSVVFSGTGA